MYHQLEVKYAADEPQMTKEQDQNGTTNHRTAVEA